MCNVYTKYVAISMEYMSQYMQYTCNTHSIIQRSTHLVHGVLHTMNMM
jgi:hypothetical protein